MLNKLLKTDSLKGKNLKHLEILPYSQALKKKDLFFPDQYYKGSIGKISGMAIVRQAKYNVNARSLYAYCKQPAWRKKVANKLGVFPFEDNRDPQSAEILLYQRVISDWSFKKYLD